jgi:hypothetical protein
VKASSVRRLCGGCLAALTLSSLAGCAARGKETPDATMLTDKDSTPRSQGVIRLQERSIFPVDEKRRPIAMVDDGEDRHLGTRQADSKPKAD